MFTWVEGGVKDIVRGDLLLDKIGKQTCWRQKNWLLKEILVSFEQHFSVCKIAFDLWILARHLLLTLNALRRAFLWNVSVL